MICFLGKFPDIIDRFSFADREYRAPDARRLRIPEGLPRGAILARHQGQPDIRRNESGHAAYHI